MRLRTLILLEGLVLAVLAVSPSAAMGAAKGSDLPLIIKGTGTTTINLITGAGTNVSSGQASILGALTNSAVNQFALVGANGFSWTATGTFVAANGDKVFTSTSGTGRFGTPIQTTSVITITGGTGRFAGASGTMLGTGQSTSVSIVGSIETVTGPFTDTGTISFRAG